MKKLTVAIACFVLLIVSATGAWASAVQITLSSSAQGSVLFTGTGNSSVVNVALSGTCGIHSNCISGAALLEPFPTLGTYQLWMVGGPGTLTLSSGPGNYAFGTGPTLWLSATFGGNTLLTQLTLDDLFGGTGKAPSFEGTFGSTTGSAIPGFPLGVNGSIDFAVRLQGSSSIATLGSGSTAKGFLSSGELVPTPEPGTLALLGTGIVGLAGAIRRRMK